MHCKGLYKSKLLLLQMRGVYFSHYYEAHKLLFIKVVFDEICNSLDCSLIIEVTAESNVTYTGYKTIELEDMITC